MKIKSVEIKNFKCIGANPIILDFSKDILVLIGENNTGKSSILQALNFFFSGKNISMEYFYNMKCDSTNAIEIVVQFTELSDKDKENDVVQPYLYEFDEESTWKLKKIYFQKEDGKMDKEYHCFNGSEWEKNPGIWRTKCDNLFTNEKMQSIFVPAVKGVDEETSAGEKSAFGKIFNLLIKEALQSKGEYKELLIALKNYQQLFTGTSQIDEVISLEQEISEKLSRVIAAKTEIKLTPRESSLLPIPKLTTNDKREVDIDPNQQGHGLQRVLIFSLLELLAETLSSADKEISFRNILLIEEPEIYMHPQMERKIADVLYDIAISKKAQVICTTHSPIFIKPLKSPESVIRLFKDKDESISAIQKKGEIFAGDKEEERKTMRMLMNFDPSVNELFFAKRVVLVEGDTESAIFPKAAELLTLFSDKNKYKKRETSLINCRSRDTIPLFQNVLNFYEIPYVVIHDLEGEKATEGKNNKILALLDNNESRRMYFDPKIEVVLEIPIKGKEIKWFKAIKQIEILHSENKLEEKLGVYTRFVYGI